VESWRVVWRDGFAPLLSSERLRRLLDILRRDDRRLTQGSTTTPPPLMCVADWPCEAGCALVCSYCEWGETTVGQAETEFARLCFEADQRLGEPAACRWFLNWFDDCPRNEMRIELAAEVELELTRRGDLPPPETKFFTPGEAHTLTALYDQPDEWWSYWWVLSDAVQERCGETAAEGMRWLSAVRQRPHREEDFAERQWKFFAIHDQVSYRMDTSILNGYFDNYLPGCLQAACWVGTLGTRHPDLVTTLEIYLRTYCSLTLAERTDLVNWIPKGVEV